MVPITTGSKWVTPRKGCWDVNGKDEEINLIVLHCAAWLCCSSDWYFSLHKTDRNLSEEVLCVKERDKKACTKLKELLPKEKNPR